ncbi:reverse transcriptase [Gossypium australe]|uniref:Reverse transcriptase n=1 Tax=Gossypium australe TaxID=47621 RepID=A0A5B6VPC9_9ROSI|nr:reverse transcriptase [Gossypium australe]
MTIVVHCLSTWRHYLLGSRFVIFTDNVANSYFLTQKKLSPNMEYKARSANTVADALSRKMEFAIISQPDSFLLEHIREGLSYDPTIKNLIELAKDGKTRELLFTWGHRLYVPQYGSLRKEVINEYHDLR